jgi:CheY-like chemotaxis protein
MNKDLIKNASFLYVEDDEPSRTVMRLIMEKAVGVRDLTIFEDSADFMARVKALSNCPDVILLDIHIRPHDGFELLRVLRAEPDCHHVKIVALTASVMNEEVEQLRSSGFDGAISKPLDISTFPDLIARILNGETVWHIS